jgi:hypothetical protein
MEGRNEWWCVKKNLKKKHNLPTHFIQWCYNLPTYLLKMSQTHFLPGRSFNKIICLKKLFCDVAKLAIIHRKIQPNLAIDLI